MWKVLVSPAPIKEKREKKQNIYQKKTAVDYKSNGLVSGKYQPQLSLITILTSMIFNIPKNEHEADYIINMPVSNDSCNVL